MRLKCSSDKWVRSAVDWMPMTLERVEGFILRAQPYQDHHHIATAFTVDKGVLRLFVRGTTRLRRNSHAIVTPLTRAEFLLSAPKSGALYRLRDATLLDQYLPLREDFDRLQTACSLARCIADSQFLWKPAPALYQLFISSVAQAAKGAHGPTVCCAFLLKLLRHEGLLTPAAQCARCRADLADVALAGGEALCATCAPNWATLLDADAWVTVCQILSQRNWQDILRHPVDATLQEQIEALFETCVE